MTRKKVFLTTIALLFSSSALAAHLDLAWDPNSEPDLGGYIVYYGTSPENYTKWIDVGKATSVRITGLPANKEYFVALTAYDVSGNESDLSSEVSGFPAPGDDPAPPTAGGGTGVSGSSSGGGCFVGAAMRLH
jgi:fibronectin type 3 domain-containing protein